MISLSNFSALVEMDVLSDNRIEPLKPAIFEKPQLSMQSLFNIPIEVTDYKRILKVRDINVQKKVVHFSQNKDLGTRRKWLRAKVKENSFSERSISPMAEFNFVGQKRS